MVCLLFGISLRKMNEKDKKKNEYKKKTPPKVVMENHIFFIC